MDQNISPKLINYNRANGLTLLKLVKLNLCSNFFHKLTIIKAYKTIARSTFVFLYVRCGQFGKQTRANEIIFFKELQAIQEWIRKGMLIIISNLMQHHFWIILKIR